MTSNFQASIGTHYQLGHCYASNQFCFQTGLHQLIHVPTHKHGNTLDLLFTNLEDSINNIQINSDSHLQSDHYNSTYTVTNNIIDNSKFVPYFTFNFSRGDYHGLCDYMLHSDFIPCYLTQNCEHILHFIEQILFKGMELFIPQCKVHPKQDPIWYNSEIIKTLYQLSKNTSSKVQTSPH